MKELLVVKAGTTTLVDTETGNLNIASFQNIGDAIKAEVDRGTHVALVTSAAISAGAAELDVSRRSYAGDFDGLSALAAVGQVPLVNTWRRVLEPLTVGQNLVTPHELLETVEGPQYFRKLKRLLEMGVVPVINENDAVADDEIRYGDNDMITAHLCNGLHALGGWAIKAVILTDVDGLYDRDPNDPEAQRIRQVSDVSKVEDYIVQTDSAHGSGGMASKKEVAKLLAANKIPLYVGDGRARDPIQRLLRRQGGTLLDLAAETSDF